MAILSTIVIALSLSSLIAASGITCDASTKETLAKDGAGSKVGTLSSTSSSKCLMALETTCDGCYMDVVFWKMALAVSGPRTWTQVGTSVKETLDDAIFVQEEGNPNLVVFQGNTTGQFFISAAKQVKIAYNGGTVKRTTDVKWNISYTVQEIKHKSCYHGVVLKHTCPDGKCTDEPYSCGKLDTHLDIPKPGITKENKTKIFMGIIGILGFLVLVFLLVLYCRRQENRKKIYLCLTCKECMCKCKRKIRKVVINPPHDEAAAHIIISQVDLPGYDEAQDMTVYPPTESQEPKQEEGLPSYDETYKDG